MDTCSEDSKAFVDYLQPAESADEDEKTAVMVEPSHMGESSCLMLEPLTSSLILLRKTFR